jgi:hypothetical protein
VSTVTGIFSGALSGLVSVMGELQKVALI